MIRPPSKIVINISTMGEIAAKISLDSIVVYTSINYLKSALPTVSHGGCITCVPESPC